MDDRLIDDLAREIHRRYVAANPDAASAGRRAARSWEELDPADRQQNIDQARSHVIRLDQFGFDIAEVEGRQAIAVEIPADIVERMAMAEHERWMTLKIAQGYRYGPVRVDEPVHDRQHPDVKHWDDLDEATRDNDRRPMRNIPDLLASVGLEVRRREP